MNTSEYTLDSHFDELGISVLVATPDSEDPKAVVQFVHGMSEYKERYLPFIEFLCNNGYACMIHDHRGHGKSVKDSEDLGYFHDSGWEGIVGDILGVNVMARNMFPDVPKFLFGHSMGGFSALNAMARGLQVSGAVLMAPYDAGFKYLYDRANFDGVMACKARGYFHLSSENALEEDAARNAEAWNFRNLLPKLDKNIPYCFIDGTKDTTSEHMGPVVEEMKQADFRVSYHLLEDGHMFPLHRATIARIALEHFGK